MEVIKKNKDKILCAFLIAIFFLVIYRFHYWLEPLTDYPHDDEHRSLLAALGFDDYFPSIYIKMLEGFAYFYKDYPSLHTFNFGMSYMALCLSFFIYHMRRKISLGTNLFFTAMLALSPLNIILCRKMHFWAAAFFFVIMTVASFLEAKKRNWFIFVSLLILGFFRVEFIFSALVALGFLIAYKKDRKKIIIAIGVSTALAIVAIIIIRKSLHGMSALVDAAGSFRTGSKEVSFYERVLSILWLNVTNVGIYFEQSSEFFVTTLKSYFFTLVNAFALLFFMINPIKKNLKHFFETYKNDFLLFYFPAIGVLLSIRYLDTYLIMFYVLLLSMMSFLWNSRDNRYFSSIIFCLIIPAFLFGLPDFSNSIPTKYWFRRTHFGQINRYIYSVVENLPNSSKDHPYKILTYEQMDGVLPNKGHQFYRHKFLSEDCAQGPINFNMIVMIDGEEKRVPKDCLPIGWRDFQTLKPFKNMTIYIDEKSISGKM